MQPPANATLDRLFAAPSFKEKDLDSQSQLIDGWFDRRMDGEDEATRKGLEMDRGFVKGMYHLKYTSENDTPEVAGVAREKLGAWKDLYSTAKNPELDSVQRADAILSFNDRISGIDTAFTEKQNRRQTLQEMVPRIMEHRKIEAMDDLDVGASMLTNLSLDPQSKLYGPGGNVEAMMRDKAGIPQEEIDAAVSDYNRSRSSPTTGQRYEDQKATRPGMSDKRVSSSPAGQPAASADTHFDVLSNGEIAFRSQGLLFPNETRERLKASNQPSLAKKRALDRLDKESDAYVDQTYHGLNTGNPLQDEDFRSRVERLQGRPIGNDPAKVGFDTSAYNGAMRERLQDTFKAGQDSPYWNQFTSGLKTGGIQVANVFPTVASTLTGGIVGEDTRESLRSSEKAASLEQSLQGEAGAFGGANATGMTLSGGVGNAVPQLAMQLGAGKIIGNMSRGGAMGAAAAGNIGFASSASLAGFQSFAGGYNEVLDETKGDKMAALGAGLTQGAITTLVTAGFGRTGAENIFESAGAKKSLTEYFGSIMAGGSQEYIEEFTDQFLSGVSAAATRNPNKTFSEIIKEGGDAGAVGFLMGAGTHSTGGLFKGGEEAPASTPDRPISVTTPEIPYDFASSSVEVSGQIAPNTDQVVQTGDGGFVVNDPAFPENRFESQAEAEAFSRNRHYERFKENVAPLFNADPAALAIVEGIAAGLSRSGINPDKQLFANILTEKDVRAVTERARAGATATAEARKAEEAAMTAEANAPAPEGTTETQNPAELNPSDFISPNETARQIYREAIETPSDVSRSDAATETITPKIDELEAEAAALRGRKRLSEAESDRLNLLDDQISNATMEEAETDRAAGRPGYTASDLVNTPLTDNVGQAIDRTALTERKNALEAELATMADEENDPRALDIHDELADIESQFQTDLQNKSATPLQPSASPTTETTATINSRIGELNARIGDVLKRAAKKGAKIDIKEESVKFLDRTGEYKAVVENMREGGFLDDGDADLLDSMGQRMNALADEWINTRPGTQMRDAGANTAADTSVSLDQSQEGPGGARGRISILPKGIAGANKVLIEGFKSGDTSTFVHEFFHALELLSADSDAKQTPGSDLPANSLLSAALGQDYAAFNNWRTKGGKIDAMSPESLERAAVGFEQYLANGRAPLASLQAAFSKMKAILSNIYQSVKGIIASQPEALGGGVELDPAAIAAYDRLFLGSPSADGKPSPVGPQPQPSRFAAMRSNPKYVSNENGGWRLPLANGDVQKGFKESSKAYAFRKKAAKINGLNPAVMSVEREGDAYFVYAYPMSAPSLFGISPIGNVGESSGIVNDAALATGLAVSPETTSRVDGREKLTNPRQISVEAGPRGVREARRAVLDFAERTGNNVHEIGGSVTNGETGLQSNGTVNAPLFYGTLKEAIPWRTVEKAIKASGINDFRYNTNTGEIEVYETDPSKMETLHDRMQAFANQLNTDESSRVLDTVSPEVRNIRLHQTAASESSSDQPEDRAAQRVRSEARRWTSEMTEAHAYDPVATQAFSALAEAGHTPDLDFGTVEANEAAYQIIAPTLDEPMAVWALATVLRGGSNKGLIPIQYTATGNPDVDAGISALVTKLRGSSRADYVLMGSHAGVTDVKAAELAPKDEQSFSEIALAKSERFSRSLDQQAPATTLNQIALPKLNSHDIERSVSAMPSGVAAFAFKPVAKILSGLEYSPLRTVQKWMESNPIAAPLAAWLRYRDIGTRSARKVAREMMAKHGEVFVTNIETGEIMNFTGNPPPGKSKHYADVIPAVMENPNAYPLSDAQRAWIADARQIIQDGVKMSLAEGNTMRMFMDDQGQIDYTKLDSNFYFPRRVVGSWDTKTGKVVSSRARSGSSSSPIEKRGFDYSRKYKTAQEGAQAGIVYDPDPLSALEAFTRSIYHKIGDIRTITDGALAGSSDPASIKRGTRMVKVGSIDAVFDETTASDIEKFITGQTQGWEPIQRVGRALSIPRMFKLSLDFGAATIQGGVLLINNPLGWVKSLGAGVSSFFDKNGARDFFVNNEADIREYVEAGGLFGQQNDYVQASMDLGEELRIEGSRWKSLHNQTLGRFEGFHSTFMDAAAIQFWKSMKGQAVNDDGTVDPAKARSVAEMCDRLVGRSSLNNVGLSKNGQGVAAMLLTAPSMYVAYSNLVGSLFSKNPTEAKIAWQQASRFVAGSSLAYIGLALAAGLKQDEIEDRLKPWKRNFMNIPLSIPGSDDKYEVGIGGFLRSFAKMTGQLACTAFDGRNNTPSDFYGPILNFAGARVSPGIGSAMSVIRGTDYFGDPKSRLALAVEAFIPVALNEPAKFVTEKVANWFGVHGEMMTKEEKELMDSSLQGALIQVTGLAAYPVAKRTQYYDTVKTQARQLFGKPYDDLSPIEKISATAVASQQLGAPPKVAGFDLDEFQRMKSERVAQYLSSDSKSLLSDTGLLKKGITGAQGYKLPNGATVPLSDDERVKIEKSFAGAMNQYLPTLNQFKDSMPEENLREMTKMFVEQAEKRSLMENGWPVQ